MISFAFGDTGCDVRGQQHGQQRQDHRLHADEGEKALPARSVKVL